MAENFKISAAAQGIAESNFLARGKVISGEVLDEPKFIERAKYFGKGSIKYITKKDFLIYGETQPTGLTSPNGCKGVDLGYNVEETIPSLVGYAQITGDKEALDIMEKTMKVHIEFMLPDGAWDNSWGTRNFKWTYWGSRTSDGCQAGFAALARRNRPCVYKCLFYSKYVNFFFCLVLIFE